MSYLVVTDGITFELVFTPLNWCILFYHMLFTRNIKLRIYIKGIRSIGKIKNIKDD